MTFHLLEVEVKTLQIFKLPNWLKIHYSFVTRINKHLWSYSISCTAPCPRVHTAYSAMFSFSLIVNRDFCSISLAHIHNTAAVSWRQGTAQERWKYTFLQWWKSGVSALGLPEYHLWPVFFPTTPREKKKSLNDKTAAIKWISQNVQKPTYLQELLWLRLGKYFFNSVTQNP